MGCATKTLRATGAVWSDGSTNLMFIGLLRAAVAQYTKMRVSFWVEGSSGNLYLSTAAIYGDTEAELATTTTTVDIPATALSATADGAYYGTEYVDLDATKQLIELGLRCKNTSGTKMEKAFVTLIVDFLE